MIAGVERMYARSDPKENFAPEMPAQANVTADRFSTDEVRPSDQHEAWCEWFRPIFEILPKQSVRNGFAAENQVWKLGGIAMSRVKAPAVRVQRQAANLRRDPVDHWIITYCRRGATMIATERRTLEAPAGVPFLWSLGEASDSERTEVDRIQLYMTRDAFPRIAPLLDAARGTVLGTPMGLLLGDYVLALERRLPTLTTDQLPQLAQAVGAMVSAAIAPSPDRLDSARRQIDLGRLERVRVVVRKNLRSPSLGPAALCRAVGISRSQLYRLLEDVGGVARYIQSQRLQEAHAMLSDTRASKPVSVVSEELCFADASTFSRAFRREFGCSPSDVRSAVPGDLALASVSHSRFRRETADFSDLLHGF
jgi:AraC-like DNA-binding protein